MRLTRSLPLILLLGGTADFAQARSPAKPPAVALFVSADVPKSASFEVQRVLRSHGIAFRAVRLRVKTDRTAVYSRETRGKLARRISGWLGGVPVEAFDWDSQYEAVVYLARDYEPTRTASTFPRPSLQRSMPGHPGRATLRSTRPSMGQVQRRGRSSPKIGAKPSNVRLGPLVGQMGYLTRGERRSLSGPMHGFRDQPLPLRQAQGERFSTSSGKSARGEPVEPRTGSGTGSRSSPPPDVLAWNDLLNRVEHLESRLRPELGEVVALVGSPLEQTVELSLSRGGWIKLQGQPIEPGVEEPVAELANATGPKQADRPVPLPLSRRIHVAGFLSILSPSAKSGQVFGQLLGPAVDVGFVWREPWIVQASMGLFSGSASVSRSDGRTDASDLTLVPFSILVLFPLGGSEFARPFVGVGPALEYQSLSNSAIFDPSKNGGASEIGFGFELKGGAQFALFRRLKVVTEVSWQAAEATLAGSREGSAIRFSLGLGF